MIGPKYDWPDFHAAEEIFCLFKEINYPDLPIDVPEKEFKHRCDQQWALNDLLVYLNENWFEDIPLEIISDYIADSKYRAEKYKDRPMGEVYKIAWETADDIIHCFENPYFEECI